MIRKSWRHKNLKESFLGALKGAGLVVKSEKNAKIILVIGVLVLILAAIFRLTIDEFTILIIVITIVFLSELFNTLAEVILDMIQPEDDPHVKILKDIASGAVLMACIGAAIVGIVLFLPKIISLLKSLF